MKKSKIIIPTIMLITAFFILLLIPTNNSKACSNVTSVMRIDCTVGSSASDDVKQKFEDQFSSSTKYSHISAIGYEMDDYANLYSTIYETYKSYNLEAKDGKNLQVVNARYQKHNVFDVGYHIGSISEGGFIGIGSTTYYYIRGSNDIVFPAKITDERVKAYNPYSAYKTCKKRALGFLWCTSESDWQYKQIYNTSASKGVINDKGELVYTDLSAVEMVMPSYEPDIYKSYGGGYLNSGNKTFTINGTNYSLWSFGKGENGYGKHATFKDDFTWKKDQRMTHLVMRYSATITYFYAEQSNPEVDGGVITLNKATTTATVYVTYEIKDGSAQDQMQPATGYLMDELGAPKSNIAYIPVQFDVTPLMDTDYWSLKKLEPKGTVKVSAPRFNSNGNNSYAKVVVDGKTIYIFTKLTSVDENGINVRAIGFNNKNSNRVVLDTTGKFYYSAPDLESSGLTVKLTDYNHDFDEKKYGRDPMNVKLEEGMAKVIWSSSSKLSIEIDTDKYFGEFFIYTWRLSWNQSDWRTDDDYNRAQCIYNSQENYTKCLNAERSKSNKNYYLDFSTDKKTEKEIIEPKTYHTGGTAGKTEMLLIKIGIDYTGDGDANDAADGIFQFCVITDNVTPEVLGVSPITQNNVVIVESVEELDELSCPAEDDIWSGDCEIVPMVCEVDPSSGQKNCREMVEGDSLTPEYIVVSVVDWLGNASAPAQYKVIVDGLSPNDIKGKLEYDTYIGDNALNLEIEIDGTIPHHEEENVEFAFSHNNENIPATIDELNSKFNKLESIEALFQKEALFVPIDEEGSGGTITIEVKDDGIPDLTSAGMYGSFVKIWTEGEEADATWTFKIGTSFQINDLKGPTYIAVISVDNMNHLYKQVKYDRVVDEEGNSVVPTTINIKFYKVSLISTPYINKVIATDEGLGFVVRDDLSFYCSEYYTTTIKDFVIVDKDAATRGLLQHVTVPTNLPSGYYSSILEKAGNATYTGNKELLSIRHSSGVDNAKVTYVKEDSVEQDVAYLNSILENGALVKYETIGISPNIKLKLQNEDFEIENYEYFNNLMLINGLLFNGNASLFVHISRNHGGTIKELYQSIDMPIDMFNKNINNVIEFANPDTGDVVDSKDKLISMNGKDDNSYMDGNIMKLKYTYALYDGEEYYDVISMINKDPYYEICYGENIENQTCVNVSMTYKECVLDEETNTVLCRYNERQYNTYYKVCYETEGSSGSTVLCEDDVKLYRAADGVIMGQVTGDVLYHIYSAILTGIEYDYYTDKLVAKYNNDESGSYTIFKVNSGIAYSNSVLDGRFEIDYCKFLYDTSVPEVTVEYVTVDEYVAGAKNFLKDPGYVEGSKNFIVKVTLFNNSDKYRKDYRQWLRLTDENFTWYPYYESTGRSVCGDIDRKDCDRSFDRGLFDIIEEIESTEEYSPIVYYLQFPLSEVIRGIDPTYSVDVVDLSINVKSSNGAVNEGLTLVVDDDIKEEKVNYTTIYYDQDAPRITITSSPEKFAEYYSISIGAKDVSSNIEKITLYYGIYTGIPEKDVNVQMLYSESVNESEFRGYSARLTQKGWYSVVATDDQGHEGINKFEVVALDDGVMFSPTLDDTDQIQSGGNEMEVVVTIVTVLTAVGIIALIIGLIVLLVYLKIKFGGAKKVAEKIAKDKIKKKATKKGKKFVTSAMNSSGEMIKTRIDSKKSRDATFEDFSQEEPEETIEEEEE